MFRRETKTLEQTSSRNFHRLRGGVAGNHFLRMAALWKKEKKTRTYTLTPSRNDRSIAKRTFSRFKKISLVGIYLWILSQPTFDYFLFSGGVLMKCRICALNYAVPTCVLHPKSFLYLFFFTAEKTAVRAGLEKALERPVFLLGMSRLKCAFPDEWFCTVNELLAVR